MGGDWVCVMVCDGVCVCVMVCVKVCVCVRERERERERVKVIDGVRVYVIMIVTK